MSAVGSRRDSYARNVCADAMPKNRSPPLLSAVARNRPPGRNAWAVEYIEGN